MAIDTAAKRQAALLDGMLTPDGEIDSYDLPRLLGQYNGGPATRFRGPTRNGVRRTLPGGDPIANRLMRYYSPIVEGVNVFILTDGTVTTTQPASWDDVRRVLWGAHDEPVTSAEAALLTAAGYSAYLS